MPRSSTLPFALLTLLACDAPSSAPASVSASASASASALSPTPSPPSHPIPDLPSAAARLFPSADSAASDFTVSPVPPSFLLATPRSSSSGPTSLHERARAHLERTVAALFHGRFTRPPPEPVVVYVFPSDATYQAFCLSHLGKSCEGTLGVYDRATGEVLVDAAPGLGTLSHEIVHPILRGADFPEAPEWLNEGIGALYEEPRFPAPGEIEGATNWRLPRLKAALSTPAGRATVRLETLFGMSNDDWRGKEGQPLRYAMARYFCQWLEQEGYLWTFYAAWRDGYADDRTGEKAFAWVQERPMREASAAWVRWIRTL